MNYEDFLTDIALGDERFIIMTAENRAAIRNINKSLGNRFIDTGITEQTLIGSSAGLALRGRIPIVHALACFLTMRAFEFIRTDIGIGELPVKLIAAVPGFLSEANGPTHQAVEDISLMRAIPAMCIFCPADLQDLLIGLKDVLLSPKPFYIRFNQSESHILHSNNFEIGKAELLSEGKDLTILTYGILLNEAFEAAKILSEKNISVRLVNLRTLKPIDEEIILSSVSQTPLLVTLEDHFLTGGLFSIVAELLLKNKVTANVLPIALENKWFKPALYRDLLVNEGFTGRQIAEKILYKLDMI
ncbi:MAG: transketolase C-terminal domain-containing protein [Bacteroidota bacterium]|nr:transketolase C-terminal domain-containing protein [Bacteroidota bacterium]